jgi:hypothetical protein
VIDMTDIHSPPVVTAAVCRYRDHHGPPVCPHHGCPMCYLNDRPDGCEACDAAGDIWYALNWPAAVANPQIGHDGEDCLHCTVCGACRGTGTVCRWCERCTAHQDELGRECEQLRWDKFVREERIFWVHSVFDTSTRCWSP